MNLIDFLAIIKFQKLFFSVHSQGLVDKEHRNDQQNGIEISYESERPPVICSPNNSGNESFYSIDDNNDQSLDDEVANPESTDQTSDTKEVFSTSTKETSIVTNTETFVEKSVEHEVAFEKVVSAPVVTSEESEKSVAAVDDTQKSLLIQPDVVNLNETEEIPCLMLSSSDEVSNDSLKVVSENTQQSSDERKSTVVDVEVDSTSQDKEANKSCDDDEALVLKFSDSEDEIEEIKSSTDKVVTTVLQPQSKVTNTTDSQMQKVSKVSSNDQVLNESEQIQPFHLTFLDEDDDDIMIEQSMVSHGSGISDNKEIEGTDKLQVLKGKEVENILSNVTGTEIIHDTGVDESLLILEKFQKDLNEQDDYITEEIDIPIEAKSEQENLNLVSQIDDECDSSTFLIPSEENAASSEITSKSEASQDEAMEIDSRELGENVVDSTADSSEKLVTQVLDTSKKVSETETVAVPTISEEKRISEIEATLTTEVPKEETVLLSEISEQETTDVLKQSEPDTTVVPELSEKITNEKENILMSEKIEQETTDLTKDLEPNTTEVKEMSIQENINVPLVLEQDILSTQDITEDSEQKNTLDNLEDKKTDVPEVSKEVNSQDSKIEEVEMVEEIEEKSTLVLSEQKQILDLQSTPLKEKSLRKVKSVHESSPSPIRRSRRLSGLVEETSSTPAVESPRRTRRQSGNAMENQSTPLRRSQRICASPALTPHTAEVSNTTPKVSRSSRKRAQEATTDSSSDQTQISPMKKVRTKLLASPDSMSATSKLENVTSANVEEAISNVNEESVKKEVNNTTVSAPSGAGTPTPRRRTRRTSGNSTDTSMNTIVEDPEEPPAPTPATTPSRRSSRRKSGRLSLGPEAILTPITETEEESSKSQTPVETPKQLKKIKVETPSRRTPRQKKVIEPVPEETIEEDLVEYDKVKEPEDKFEDDMEPIVKLSQVNRKSVGLSKSISRKSISSLPLEDKKPKLSPPKTRTRRSTRNSRSIVSPTCYELEDKTKVKKSVQKEKEEEVPIASDDAQMEG